MLQSGCTVYCVFKEDLLVTSSSQPLDVSSGCHLLLRTKTPLTTLIGDGCGLMWVDYHVTCTFPPTHVKVMLMSETVRGVELRSLTQVFPN